MLELEKTYLAKYLPRGLKKCRKVEMIDRYIPISKLHPSIRIRKKDNYFELSRKAPISKKDLSIQEEINIKLDEVEYSALIKIPAKVVHKIRYYFPYQGRTAEIDIFLDKLKGLVTIEFEFKNIREMRKFKMPDFCLADVTHEKHSAGGHIAGRSYLSLKPLLEKYNYKTINLKS
jgi:CYTH domain-containing protein